MKIYFYVDSFGYGHITRQIALARAFLWLNKKSKICFLTSSHFNLIARSIKNVSLNKIDDHIKFKVNKEGIDIEATIRSNTNLLERLTKNVNQELMRLGREKPDIIISDIRPEPFLAAQELGIPCYGVSNFSWFMIVSSIFGHKHQFSREYKKLYAMATRAFVLPFGESMNVFKNRTKVGLLRRRITNRMARRNRILVALGKSRKYCLQIDKSLLKRGIDIIPKNVIESQNYVASYKFILGKLSYGIVSEAIPYGNPIFFIRKENFKESEFIAKDLIKPIIKPEGSSIEEWLNHAIENVDFGLVESLKSKYSKNSDLEIAEQISADNF